MTRAACGIGVALVAVVFAGLSAEAAPPAAPPVSKFAPAKDLESQVDYYVERLTEGVASADDYADNKETVWKDANTLAVIALALGMHDTKSKYQASAGELLAAAQKLAEAEDYASAAAALKAVQAAASGGTGSAELSWKPVASLEALMKQVPLVNTKLKRVVPRRMERSADEAAGHAAVLGAIAQATLADTHEATSDEQVQQWYDFSAQMREAAAAVNRAIRANDKDAAGTAMDALQKSCDDCHAVFHPEETGK